MKFRAYCACGGAIRGTIKGSDEKKAHQILSIFRQIHMNPDCQPCDPKTARKARKAKKKPNRKPVS